MMECGKPIPARRVRQHTHTPAVHIISALQEARGNCCRTGVRRVLAIAAAWWRRIPSVLLLSTLLGMFSPKT
jgi:hypothetical protein